MDIDELFEGDRVLPVVTVNNNTNEVLMVGYMNKDAYEHTLKTHRVWYYSKRSDKISMKGAHSGNTQRIMSIRTDDKMSAILIKAEQKGKVCDKDNGYDTCFIYELYKRKGHSSRRRKFGKVEVEKDFDFSKEDYSE